MSDVVWGILGCGAVTEVKSGPALSGVERSRLAAVMRRDGAKARDYAQRHGVPRWYDDADALLADPEITAVYIATPPASHAALTIRALNAGKHVLVEKPMALNTSECDAMMAAANASGKSLTVAYYRRAQPRFETFRELVVGGAIGRPLSVSLRHTVSAKNLPPETWKQDPETNGGGLFVDMHVHALDWLSYAFGPVSSLHANTRWSREASNVEAGVAYTARCGDILVAALCAYDTGVDEDVIAVTGDAGAVHMAFAGASPITLEREGVRETIDAPPPQHAHEPFVERLIAHILDGALNPCTGEDARATTALCTQILRRHPAGAE